MRKSDILAALASGHQFLVYNYALHGEHVNANLLPDNSTFAYPVFNPRMYGGFWDYKTAYLVDAVEPSDNGWKVHYTVKGSTWKKDGVTSRHVLGTVAGVVEQFGNEQFGNEQIHVYMRLSMGTLRNLTNKMDAAEEIENQPAIDA